MLAPIVAPKCTKGPYCPTEPPAEIETMAEKEARKPDFIFNFYLLECADRITSGGPCQRLPRPSFLNVPTNNPAITGKITT